MRRFCDAGEQIDCPSTAQTHPLRGLDTPGCTCCTESATRPLSLLQARLVSRTLGPNTTGTPCAKRTHTSLEGARSSSEAFKRKVTVTEEHEIKKNHEKLSEEPEPVQVEEMATGTDEASWAQDRHVAASDN